MASKPPVYLPLSTSDRLWEPIDRPTTVCNTILSMLYNMTAQFLIFKLLLNMTELAEGTIINRNVSRMGRDFSGILRKRLAKI